MTILGWWIRLAAILILDQKDSAWLIIAEITEVEITEAETLPFPSLLGVVEYPSCYTKIEMKYYAMSVLSRWRTKWGVSHFEVLIND
jgi:hypothetical protein